MINTKLCNNFDNITKLLFLAMALLKFILTNAASIIEYFYLYIVEEISCPKKLKIHSHRV